MNKIQFDMIYLAACGVDGSVERGVENRVKKFREKNGSKSRFRYLWSRLFPDTVFIEKYYFFFYKHKILLPFGYVYRLLRMLFDKERRKNTIREIKVVKRVK